MTAQSHAGSALSAGSLRISTAPRDGAVPDRSATARRSWLAVFGVLCVVVLARVPHLYRNVSERVPPEFSEQISDPEMQALALKIGTGLAAGVYVFAIGMYFSLAATLEHRLLPRRLTGASRLPYGPFFVAAAAATLPVQLAGLVLGATEPQRGPWTTCYLAALAVAVPLALRHQLRPLGRRRAAVVVATLWALLALVSAA